MRLDWDQYFMRFARIASERSTCPRKQVGCVIVKDNHILATGYNGSVRGSTHCIDVGCLMVDGHCVRAIHAEQNAVLHAAKVGTSVDAAICYTTASPCWVCFRSLAQAGIRRFVYAEPYRSEDYKAQIEEVCQNLSIEVIQIIEQT